MNPKERWDGYETDGLLSYAKEFIARWRRSVPTILIAPSATRAVYLCAGELLPPRVIDSAG